MTTHAGRQMDGSEEIYANDNDVSEEQKEIADDDPEKDMIHGIVEEDQLVPESKPNLASGLGGSLLQSAMMGKLSTGLLARAFLPSPDHVKEGLGYLDLGIKVQIILHELSSSLFWSSVGEVFLFLFSFFIFFTDPREMGAIFFHLAHVLRGALGFFIVKKMPNSHEVVALIQLPASKPIPFNQIGTYVITGAKASASKFGTECGKLLLGYFALTIASFLLDLISFFMQVSAYKEANPAFSDVALLFLACIFMTIDLYYVAWIASTKMKLPDYASTYVALGLIGVVAKLNKALDDRLEGMADEKKGQVKAQREGSKNRKEKPK